MNEIVSLKDIVVDFDGERILDELSLDIHDKEFVTFLGPSGCGTASALPKCSIIHKVLSALLAWHLPHLARRIGT